MYFDVNGVVNFFMNEPFAALVLTVLFSFAIKGIIESLFGLRSTPATVNQYDLREVSQSLYGTERAAPMLLSIVKKNAPKSFD